MRIAIKIFTAAVLFLSIIFNSTEGAALVSVDPVVSTSQESVIEKAKAAAESAAAVTPTPELTTAADPTPEITVSVAETPEPTTQPVATPAPAETVAPEPTATPAPVVEPSANPAPAPATTSFCSYCNSADHSGNCPVKAKEDALIGRWSIPSVGVDVACYIATDNAAAVAFCDAVDSATYFELGTQYVIGDHNNQGFDAIKRCTAGTKAYMTTANGAQEFVCTQIFTGHNNPTYPHLTDDNGIAINYMNPGGITCYTCNDCWQNITIVMFQPVEQGTGSTAVSVPNGYTKVIEADNAASLSGNYVFDWAYACTETSYYCVECFDSASQAVCDAPEAACCFQYGSQTVITDQRTQDVFSFLLNCTEGNTSFFSVNGRNRQYYTCTGVITGYNTGTELTDLNGNSLRDANPGGVTCYTTTAGNGSNVVLIAFFQPT